MKSKIQHLSSLMAAGILFGVISWGAQLHAQTPDPAPAPGQPSTQPQQNPGQAPNEPGQPQQTAPGQPTDQPSQTTPAPAQSPAPQQNPGQTPNEPGQPQQTPQNPPAAPNTAPNAAPNANQGSSPNASAPTAGGMQTMTGTVVKQGSKYVFQDAATGTTYDIDHQDEVKTYDGKKVKVHGTVDAATKTIHIN